MYVNKPFLQVMGKPMHASIAPYNQAQNFYFYTPSTCINWLTVMIFCTANLLNKYVQNTLFLLRIRAYNTFFLVTNLCLFTLLKNVFIVSNPHAFKPIFNTNIVRTYTSTQMLLICKHTNQPECCTFRLNKPV